MKIEKADQVFTCCGSYLVPIGAAKEKPVICPVCGNKPLKVRVPVIKIIKVK